MFLRHALTSVSQIMFNTLFTRFNCAAFTALLFLLIQASREDAIFKIYSSSYNKHTDRLELIQSLAKACADRDAEHRKTSMYTAFKGDLGAGSFQLLSPQGACGTASANFVSMCRVNGVQARLCQLQCNGKTTHIIAEVFNDGRWGVSDPLFGTVFISPSHQIATVQELQKDWSFYRSQANSYYRVESHNFSEYTRTNWQQNAVMMVLQRILRVCIGDACNEISLRTYTLDSWFYSHCLTALLIFINCTRVFVHVARPAMSIASYLQQQIQLRPRRALAPVTSSRIDAHAAHKEAGNLTAALCRNT